MTLAPETTDLKIEIHLDGDWFAVCELTRLLPGRGVAALLPDGRQAALFRDRYAALCTPSTTAIRSAARRFSPAA